MKKIIVVSYMLAASLLTSAVAFCGSGPYGAFGPNAGSNMLPGAAAKTVTLSRGTGPYGLFGPVNSYEAVVASQRVAITRGSGPYGGFGPLSTPGTMATKECLMVAANCATEK